MSDTVTSRTWPAHLPQLKWPWYWHIEVTAGPGVHVRIYLKRRWLGLFRTAIGSHGGNYLIMKAGEEFSIERAHEVCDQAEEIYDERFRQRETISLLSTHFPGTKVTKS